MTLDDRSRHIAAPCGRALARCFGLALVVALWIPAPASGQDYVVSPDVTLSLGTQPETVADHDVARQDGLGGVTLQDLGNLPEASEVAAWSFGLDGAPLISFETAVSLPGSVTASRGDVVRYSAGSYTIVLNGQLAGIPTGAYIDALSATAVGLLLSFDTTVTVGGLTVPDEDVVLWTGSSFLPVFDGSASGVSSALDVDAVHDLGGGDLLLSFDTAGEVAGVAFADEDVLRFESGLWSLDLDGSAVDAAWAPGDLDALPEPASSTLLFTGALAVSYLASRRARGPRKGCSSRSHPST